MFNSVKRRYLCLENVNTFSLFDLTNIFNKNLFKILEPLVICGAEHIENCEVF